MTAVAHLAAHPELPRPTLRVGFTPDEEIGEGATLFDVERFGAVCAYTIDGSDARRAPGRDVQRRQGDARRSTAWTSTRAGPRASSSTPAGGRADPRRAPRRQAHARRRPRGARGSSTPTSSRGTAGRAVIARHRPRLRRRPAGRARRAAAAHRRARSWRASRARGSSVGRAAVPEHAPLHRRVPGGRRDGRARARAPRGSSPSATPIRGGTDGSLLSAMGLPTPNLFTGGHEYHSVREWASLQEMAAAAATIVRLAEAWTDNNRR